MADKTIKIRTHGQKQKKKNPINFSSPFLAQYLRLTTISWFTGVGLAPEPVGSSGTGRRKSYSRRIKRDKLNNCAVVRGATTAQHKHRADSAPYGPQHYVFICQLLTLRPAGLVQAHKETESGLLVNNCAQPLIDSLLARSRLHMHRRNHWMTKIILPLATLSLSGEG